MKIMMIGNDIYKFDYNKKTLTATVEVDFFGINKSISRVSFPSVTKEQAVDIFNNYIDKGNVIKYIKNSDF